MQQMVGTPNGRTADSRIAILIVVSPGEEEMAADALKRAVKYLPRTGNIYVVNNAGIRNWEAWQADVRAGEHDLQLVTLNGVVPKPYFEIARTILTAICSIQGQLPDILYKIDPDTLVLRREFFTTVQELHARCKADFYACCSSSSRSDYCRRVVRILSDCFPIGFERVSGNSRYGKGLHIRIGKVWYAGVGLLVPSRKQPSGGFYAISGRAIRMLSAVGQSPPEGRNGLEWNDDTIVPMLIRKLGGVVLDIRKATNGAAWRWLHGSRYFTNSQAMEPDLVAVHPVKMDEDGTLLRSQIGL